MLTEWEKCCMKGSLCELRSPCTIEPVFVDNPRFKCRLTIVGRDESFGTLCNFLGLRCDNVDEFLAGSDDEIM
jgi:hypothetical protein